MLDIREELKFCCNEFLRDGKETDALNYVSVLNRIDEMIKSMGCPNAVSSDIVIESDEICLRMNICRFNYSEDEFYDLAIIKISNGKVIFKDILEDEFYDAVNILIHKRYLLES